MPIDSYKECIKSLEEAQETETDNRDMAQECDIFLNKRGGQWDDRAKQAFDGRPRYTFDEISPIIDDIMGEMDESEFDIRVNPAGGEASKDTAEAFEGIIRNIENISNAQFTYSAAARTMIGQGISGWRIVHDFKDGDTFDKDLLIWPVPSFYDTVWFDPDFSERSAKDAMFCWVVTSMTRAKYDKKYPNGSGIGVGDTREYDSYYYRKPDELQIGEYLYKVKKEREIALMSNGMVLPVDDAFNMLQDEFQAAGITVQKTRKRPYYEVKQRVFDGKDWLTDAKDTPFCELPIIPVFGNFTISEKKVLYYALTMKLQDPQRIINYSESRKIENAAFSGRQKHWMTKDQAKSPDVIRSLRSMNINADPVQFYDWVDGQPPPFYTGQIQGDPALIETTASARSFIQRISSTFDEARGTAPAQRSGIAIDKLQQKSDNPKRKWFQAMEVALTQTYNVLIKAIPKVYDTKQEMRLIGQDGTSSSVTIFEPVTDSQTGQVVELYDLNKGNYDVICTAGPAFHSRQQETVTAINELAAIDPSIIQMGADVLLNNINAPGLDILAERKRAQMVAAGIIPPSQLTKEEAAQLQQQKAQQGQQQPTPLDQANLMIAQAQLEETKGRNQERAVKLQIEEQKLATKQMELQFKEKEQQQKIMVDNLKALTEQVKTQAEALKIIREAMGADTVVSPTVAAAFEGQARDLVKSIAEN